jgi:hypothetical protein
MFIRSAGKGAARMHVSRFDVLVTVTNVSSTSLWVMVPVGWRKTSTPPCHRPPRIEKRDGAHGRTRTAGLLLTKEVLVDQSLIGAPLRSNAEAIANNRCLAALPRKSIRRDGAERHEACVGRRPWGVITASARRSAERSHRSGASRSRTVVAVGRQKSDEALQIDFAPPHPV